MKAFTMSSIAEAVGKAKSSCGTYAEPVYEVPRKGAETWVDSLAAVIKNCREFRADTVRKIHRATATAIEEKVGLPLHRQRIPTSWKENMRSVKNETGSLLGWWGMSELKAFASASYSQIYSELQKNPFVASFSNALLSGINSMSFASGKSNTGEKMLDLMTARGASSGLGR